MSDFGRILDQWEANVSSRIGRADDADDSTAKQIAAYLDSNPPPNKDALDDDDRGSPHHRVRPDRVRIDDTIDLHGLTLEAALAATARFIDESVENGYRKVLVVHGKGENGQGILRREIRTFLEKHPATGAMGNPKGADGGRGALWVMLRINETE